MNSQSSLRVLLIESDGATSRQLAAWLANDATVSVECVADLEAARAHLLAHAHTDRRIDVSVLRLDAAAQLAPSPQRDAPDASGTLPHDDPIYNVVAAWHTMAPHIPLVGILTTPNASIPTHQNNDPGDHAGMDHGEADHTLGQRAIRAGAQDYLIASVHRGQEMQRILWGAQIRHAQLLLRARHISQPLPPTDTFPGPLVIGDNHSAIIHSAENYEAESPAPESPTLEQMMEALRASEARLHAIIESEPECVKLVALDGRVLDMNPAGLRLIEADDRSQIVNQPIASVLHPEDAKAFFQLHRQAAQGENGTLQFRIIGLKGTERWMETHSTPLRDSNGEITAVLSVTRDITESRQGHNVIMRMAHAVSLPLGEHFLENLTRDAVSALGVKGAVVAQLDPTDPHQVQTQTFFLDGEFQTNVCYRLEHTPCKNVMEGESCVYARDIQQHFPHATCWQILASNRMWVCPCIRSRAK